MKTAEILKDLRKSANLTQKELAEQLHIGQSTIVGYEQGRNEPVISILSLYAKYFNVTIDELIGRDTFSPEERAAGLSETKKVAVTPLEDDLLYSFRQVGKKHGEEAQRAILEIITKMI